MCSLMCLPSFPTCSTFSCLLLQALEAMQQQQMLMQTQPTEDPLQGLHQQDDLQQQEDQQQQDDDGDMQLLDDLQLQEQQPDLEQHEGGAGDGDLLGGRPAPLAGGLDSPGAQSGMGSDSGSGSEADGKAELTRLLMQRGIKHGTTQGQQLARLLQGARAPAAAAAATPDTLKVGRGSR